MLLLSITDYYQVLATLFLGSCFLGLPIFFTARNCQNLLSTLLRPVVLLRTQIDKLRCIYDWPNLIQDRYNQARGQPFVIDTPDARITFISSKQLINEVDKASDDILSLQAAAKWLIQPQYSMHKFDWPERRGYDGAPQVETLRNLLRHALPHIMSKSYPSNFAIMDKMFSQHGNKICVNDMVRTAVAHTNALAFFGEDLANNPKFIEVAVRFTKEVIVIGEVVRLLPSFVGERVARFLEGRFHAQRTMFHMIKSVVERRLKEQEQSMLGEQVSEHNDCIQWVMEQSSIIEPGTAYVTSPWSADRISHELMAFWFGSFHAISVTAIFAAQDLCLHPEYIDPLRREVEGPAYQIFEETGNGLPLLDSFLKESSRMVPVDNMSTRRKALQPFEFSNGLSIRRGEWICTPAKSMHYDPQRWTEPHEFHGFRHVDPSVLASVDSSNAFKSPQPLKARPFTDIRWAASWQTWGTGHIACPGRFYAAAALKQILGLIISRCDLEFKEKTTTRCLNYRSCALPSLNMSVVLSPRAEKPGVM